MLNFCTTLIGIILTKKISNSLTRMPPQRLRPEPAVASAPKVNLTLQKDKEKVVDTVCCKDIPQGDKKVYYWQGPMLRLKVFDFLESWNSETKCQWKTTYIMDLWFQYSRKLNLSWLQRTYFLWVIAAVAACLRSLCSFQKKIPNRLSSLKDFRSAFFLAVVNFVPKIVRIADRSPLSGQFVLCSLFVFCRYSFLGLL